MKDDLERFLANARGLAATAKVVHLGDLPGERVAERWGLAALRGRLVELSARGAVATLTAAIELVVEAQTESEPVAWITLGAGTFYPPDAADSGVDLGALAVVRAPDGVAAARAAERMLRSGAFGLVVLDLVTELTTAIQGRLLSLAQMHDAAVVCLTEKSQETPSLGSVVSLRAEALRRRERDGFHITVRALKDKRRGPGWTHELRRGGPSGFY
jgi:recombination protein RecA